MTLSACLAFLSLLQKASCDRPLLFEELYPFPAVLVRISWPLQNQSLIVIKAYQFTMEVLREQNILRFEISVRNSLFMHELQCGYDLSCVELNQVSRQNF